VSAGAPLGPLVGPLVGPLLAELGEVFGALDTLAGELVAICAGAGGLAGRPARDDLIPLRPSIFEILQAHRGLVAGAGIITAPDLLRDAPRWLEWWWTNAAGSPEALRINLDPAAPDFFDYTTADWYATPLNSLARRVAGPYVDYACTNEYAVTLSTPVRAGSDLLGVAAADVLVSSLETRVLPALTGIGHPAVLANADGRVIASNSPHWAPGMRVPVDGVTTSPDPASPLRSWVLVEVD
jgi:hypothetical protein